VGLIQFLGSVHDDGWRKNVVVFETVFSIATFFREVFSDEPIFRIGIAISLIPAILENVISDPVFETFVQAEAYGGFR
jgi:hypothetical protein